MVFKDHQLPSTYFYRSCEGKSPSLLRGTFCVLLLIFLVILRIKRRMSLNELPIILIMLHSKIEKVCLCAFLGRCI